MVESIGNRLKSAREARGASLEEVARDTKIRVPRLVDLENEDYSNFPSLIYAKGFLKNYANYLEVDISEYIDNLGTEEGLGTDSYQYLAHEPKTGERARRKPKSQLPKILLSLVVLALLLATALAWLFIDRSMKRLQTVQEDSEFIGIESETGQAESETGQAGSGTGQESDSARATPESREPGQMTSPSPREQVREEPVLEPEPTVMRAVPVNTSAAADPDAPVYTISLRPIERTWVKIIRDEISSQPVYEDWLGPEGGTQQFIGKKFWITVMERGAVEIRKDDEIVEFEGTAVVIE